MNPSEISTSSKPEKVIDKGDEEAALEIVRYCAAKTRGWEYLTPQILAALTRVRQETWRDAIAIARNPRLKSGLWDAEQDKAAEAIQERVAVALEYASQGKNYRNSLVAARDSVKG